LPVYNNVGISTLCLARGTSRQVFNVTPARARYTIWAIRGDVCWGIGGSDATPPDDIIVSGLFGSQWVLAGTKRTVVYEPADAARARPLFVGGADNAGPSVVTVMLELPWGGVGSI
jgi:hypothetical protein